MRVGEKVENLHVSTACGCAAADGAHAAEVKMTSNR